MPAQAELVVSAEAAFIAELTDRQMNRVIDEELMPKALFERRGSTRRFTRLCAGFANFYFDTEDVLIAGARRPVLEELTQRVVKSRARPIHSSPMLTSRRPASTSRCTPGAVGRVVWPMSTHPRHVVSDAW